ncbi:MAG: DUF3489 domain-containing protein [Acidobacteriota bacterium]|nr:DUF3489 domain-containing protein [Acidobacteriota bacterium]
MTRDDLTTWARDHGWKLDRWGHLQKEFPNGTHRLKLSRIAARHEIKTPFGWAPNEQRLLQGSAANSRRETRRHDFLNQETTMTTFAIATDNNITAFAAAEQVPEGQDRFTTEKEFAKLSADWPLTRFPEVWNAFAGVVPFDSLKPVKKFTDRKTAVTRIWRAIQALTPAPAPEAAPVAPKKAEATKQAKAKDATPTARDGSKKAIVLELIRRTDGASLKEIMAATDWQAHSVRGFISGGLGKKMGLTVESFKRPDGERAYRTA